VPSYYKKSATTSALVKPEEYKSDNAAIDIRIKNNKAGNPDYQVINSPSHNSSTSTYNLLKEKAKYMH
jgi:hypothetical protein